MALTPTMRGMCGGSRDSRELFQPPVTAVLGVLGEDFTGRARKSGCSWQREEAVKRTYLYSMSSARCAFHPDQNWRCILTAVCAVVHGRMKSGRYQNVFVSKN